MYVDLRVEEDGQSGDWDEAKLQEVVEKKHGEANKKIPTTNIVSVPPHLFSLSLPLSFSPSLSLFFVFISMSPLM